MNPTEFDEVQQKRAVLIRLEMRVSENVPV